jgi:hypothetical protein
MKPLKHFIHVILKKLGSLQNAAKLGGQVKKQSYREAKDQLVRVGTHNLSNLLQVLATIVYYPHPL